ncbi:hypothetical protein F2Q69_00063312 [Brassica cretica]|uniref:Secreted protein n=1 Tax=Brassica cretica TaxID=69181 RepID=A0A8S9RL87_BRACR|nr:hypothetical protein F2Q69_00063312 [Brassica cretica]
MSGLATHIILSYAYIVVVPCTESVVCGLASHTSLGDSPVAHPSFFPLQDHRWRAPELSPRFVSDVTVNRDEVTRTRIGTTTFATTNHHGHRSTPPPAANHWGDSSHVTVQPHSGRRSHRHQPYASCLVFVSFRSGVMRARAKAKP